MVLGAATARELPQESVTLKAEVGRPVEAERGVLGVTPSEARHSGQEAEENPRAWFSSWIAV